MLTTIKINPETRVVYFPKDLVDQGLVGECACFTDVGGVFLLNYNYTLTDALGSLKRIKEVINFLQESGQTFPIPPGPNIGDDRIPVSSELRWKVWERDNFTCQGCGTRLFLSIDHIIPESKGGLTTEENLNTLCRSCNSKKGNRKQEEKNDTGESTAGSVSTEGAVTVKVRAGESEEGRS